MGTQPTQGIEEQYYNCFLRDLAMSHLACLFLPWVIAQTGQLKGYFCHRTSHFISLLLKKVLLPTVHIDLISSCRILWNKKTLAIVQKSQKHNPFLRSSQIKRITS